MEIKVGLVVFAEKCVLVERRGNIFSIPETSLPDHRNSLYLIKQLLENTLGITGSWPEIEVGLNQSGVFDDVDRCKSHREIMIVYSLFLPAKNRERPGYEWMNLLDLPKNSFYLDHESIIRYCGVSNGSKCFSKI